MAMTSNGLQGIPCRGLTAVTGEPADVAAADWANVANATPIQARRTVATGDEGVGVPLHDTHEGGAAFSVVLAGLLRVLRDDGGAVGAAGGEDVGDDGIRHSLDQPARWKQRAIIVAAPQRSWVFTGKAVLVDGAAAEPAPDAVDDDGIVVAFDDQDGAG